MYQDLAKVVARYRCRGIVAGSDFLLSPELAIAWVEELADLGVLIVGLDLSRHVPEKGDTLELVGAGDPLNRQLSSTDVQYNADRITTFLRSELPKDADLVSFVYADPDAWDFILRHARCQ